MPAAQSLGLEDKSVFLSHSAARASRSLGLRNEALTKPSDDDSCEVSDSETGLKTKNQVADRTRGSVRHAEEPD